MLNTMVPILEAYNRVLAAVGAKLRRVGRAAGSGELPYCSIESASAPFLLSSFSSSLYSSSTSSSGSLDL